MFFIAYTFKGQVHVFAGQVKIVCHSSCRTSAILKYFCPLWLLGYVKKTKLNRSVTCLTTDALLTADSEVASLIPARSHTFVEIDHE